MEIRQQFVASTAKVYGGVNPFDYITVHETANQTPGAGAQAHADLQSRGNVREASWQWSVDDHLAIQSFRNDQRCWHAGDGRGPGNYSSVAIEICINPNSDFVTAVRNAAELTRRLMAEGGVPLSHVVDHNHWSGKNCPTWLRAGTHGIDWAGFIALVSGSPAPTPKPAPAPRPTPAPQPALRLAEDGKWGTKTTRAQQEIADTVVDGVISHQLRGKANENIYACQYDRTRLGSTLARWQQRRLAALGLYNSTIDGLIGPKHVNGLQMFYGTAPAGGPDGFISEVSATVKAMQREINSGSFLGVRG